MAMRRAAAEPEGDRLQSVKRSLAVLEALAVRPNGATPKEISQALDLHLSTSYRLLNTLAAAGYAVRCQGGGLFRLGPRIAFLHHGYLTALRPPAEALPFVHALQLATGETAMLGQLEGDDVVVTAVVAGSRPGAFPPGYIGLAAPAHAVAAGRALLAWLPAAQLDAYLARYVMASASPFPLTNPNALRAELAGIRQTGYALDRGGHPDVCCIAAPIVDRDDVVASSITTLAPCARFLREEPALVTVILAVARAIGALQPAVVTRDDRDGADLVEPEVATQERIEAALAMVSEVMSRVG
jgi:DNA-binding IclR family transcriptional regulator